MEKYIHGETPTVQRIVMESWTDPESTASTVSTQQASLFPSNSGTVFKQKKLLIYQLFNFSICLQYKLL